MIYAYAELTVTNPESMAAYREKAGEALAKHGGSVVSASPEFTILDGAPVKPSAAAILGFPDKASAEAWANDPELADVHALRRNGGASNILLLG